MKTTSSTLNNLTVADSMRHGVMTCPPETPLPVVARMMAEHRIHSVVVTDLDGVSEHAWAIVTDLDLLTALEGDVAECTAAEAAATELITVRADDALERAASLMREHQVSHVVVARGGHPVGVLSSLDIAEAIAEREWAEPE